MNRKEIPSLVLILLWLVATAGAASGELQAQAQLLMKSPDVTISGTYEMQTRPDVLESILRTPVLLARLWEVYEFTPLYKARLQGEGIHVDDPTGIAGDIFLVEQSGNRRVYVGNGALNHKLVPSFRGKMALVLTATPKGSAVSARIDVYIRTDSRVLGFLTRTMFPLVKTRALHRLTANATDIGTILEDLSNEPQKTAARLKKEDAAALLKILPQPPQAVPAAAKTQSPAKKTQSSPQKRKDAKKP